MRWTSRRLGIWELCQTRWLWVRGTTPTNAGVWTLDVSLGYRVTRPAVWLNTGRHWGLMLWLDESRVITMHRHRDRCDCWECTRGQSLRQARLGWDVSHPWQRVSCWRCHKLHPRHCDTCSQEPPCADHVCSWPESEEDE